MKFPEKPTCHLDQQQWPQQWVEEFHVWTHRGPYRFCGYCGSLHPEDLLTVLALEDVSLGGAAWKYGWPHKFYIYGVPDVVKWYNWHLFDEGYDDEAMNALLAALTQHSGIEWFKNDEGQLAYRAPHFGFQKMGSVLQAVFDQWKPTLENEEGEATDAS